MTGLERQQNVSGTGWALPALTPAPAAGERQRLGLGAARAGNFHPFPRAGGCTLTPVPSPRAAPGPLLQRPWVGSRRCVGMSALAGIASELPAAPPTKQGGAGPESDGLGLRQLAHRLHDAHSICAEPARVFIYVNYMLFLTAMRLLKHLRMLQPSSAELHGPRRVSGATRV